jgi:hypothetical protein
MMALFDGRPALRRGLLWAVPIGLLLVIIGIELYRESAAGDEVPVAATRPPNPLNVTVLPTRAPGTGDDTLGAIGEHTLFNPTRHPAPPALATDDGPTRIPKGKYVLTGTTVYSDGAVAYLKNTKDGKQHSVHKGDKLDGMQVAEVTATSVRLAVGSDSEQLELKVAAGPRTTIQPPPPPGEGAANNNAGANGGGGAALAPPPPRQPQGDRNINSQAQAQQDSVAARRRAARAAQQGSTGTGSNAQAPARTNSN